MNRVFLFVSGIIILFSQCSVGQWVNDSTQNTVIASAPYNQAFPAIISDGTGGAIITWTDQRDGLYEFIYRERIDASGVAVWGGGKVCDVPGAQENSSMASDGAGGALIAWSDYRGDGDVYMQHVNSSGAAQWSGGGVSVSAAAGTQKTPLLVPDGIGGAVVTWLDNRGGARYEVYAQRISGAGVTQWTTDGVVVDTGKTLYDPPVIASDGARGGIIAWRDEESGVDVQRIDSTGTAKWTANGVRVSSNGVQYAPAIASDGAGGAIVAWYDIRNGAFDHNIFAQRFNASGVAQWTTNGVSVCSAVYDQTYPVIISDGSGGAIIAWIDLRSRSTTDIYAQRLNASGSPQWITDGVAICTATGNQDSPSLVSDSAGGAVVTWTDARTGSTRIYSQKINAGGAVQWNDNGIAVCAAVSAKGSPCTTSDNAGGVIAAWYDLRFGDADIYAQRIFSGSTLPVELVSFSIRKTGSSSDLQWKTASEVNNYGFEVERMSMNNEQLIFNNWTKVGFVEGAGTSATPKSYSFTDKITNDGKYRYRLKQIDRNGSFKYSQEIEVQVNAAPAKFSLNQNYPNPFNPATNLQFTIADLRFVELKVYDMLGREVATLVNEEKAPGLYSVKWDASNIPSGTYIYRLRAGNFVETKKMILMK